MLRKKTSKPIIRQHRKLKAKRHICNRVYKVRPGDNQKWVKARERLHKVFDAYNVSYQVRSNAEVQV